MDDSTVPAFLAAGFGLIQIPLGEKGPRIRGWQRRDKAIFGAENAARFASCNAGLIHQHSGTCAIDIDDSDAADDWLTQQGVVLERLFMQEGAVSVSSGRSGRGKLLYRLPGGIAPLSTTKIKDDRGRVILELRCVGAQDVIAGKHPSGSEYTVIGDPAAMPTLPPPLLSIWRSMIDNRTSLVSPTADSDAVIEEGARDDSLFRIGRQLHVLAKLTEPEIYQTLREVNDRRCRPPLGDADIRRIAHSAATAPQRQPAAKFVSYGRTEIDANASVPFSLIWATDSTAMLDAHYVIKNVINSGELMVIYGPPKSGKTFLATDIALSVAAGRSWFGHRTQPGLVIYIAAEMGTFAQRRVRAWLNEYMPGTGAPPCALVPHAVNLLDELDVERLFATIEGQIEGYGQPKLIEFDTLARSLVGGDENSAQDMGRAIAVADRIRDRFNAATSLVHHSGKELSKGARGSSALLGAADTYVRVEAGALGEHLAEIEWSRNGVPGQRLGFKLPVVELGIDPDGEPVTTCIVKPTTAPVVPTDKRPRRDVALDALRETISEHGQTLSSGSSTIPPGSKFVTIDQWLKRWLLRTGYDASKTESVRVNFDKDRRALLAAGKIGISSPYVWLE
jgi:hypothetical protein